MSRIAQLTIEQKRLSTAEAELWIVVQVEDCNAVTELRGSLVGPRCANAETVQIAYALKQIRPSGYAADVLVGRIVIEEPNCSTPDTPFIYEGKVELWQDGKCIDAKPVRTSFKAS